MKNHLFSLLKEGPTAINIGLTDFSRAIAGQDTRVIQVNWSPPPKRDAELDDILDQLL